MVQLLRIVDYGPYRQGQGPGNAPVSSPAWDAQMNQDLTIIAQEGANTVRIYGLDDQQSYVVQQAKIHGLEVIPSVYLSNPNGLNGPKDPRPSFASIIAQNSAIKQQLDSLISLLNDPNTDLSNIPFVVIGNEEISQVGGWYDGAILDAIQYVRSRTPVGIKFTTAESAGGQYYVNPSLAQHASTLGNGVDVIYANILPYWENVPISQAVAQVVTEYQQLVATYPGKQVVISETGWPSSGLPQGAAVPSLTNEQVFWQEFIQAANQNGIPYGAFEGFDEPWKSTSINGNTVEDAWGLNANNRDPKTPVTSLSGPQLTSTQYFNRQYYLNQNPDVAASGMDPLTHYEIYGWKEGRDPSAVFNTKAYLAANPDVAAAGLVPLDHYLTWGANEHRMTFLASPHGVGTQDPLVDDAYYFSNNPDVATVGLDPTFHFETYGWKEGRAPDRYFDTKYYLQHNPDVAAAGVDPMLHYELSGWREGRDPSALFSTSKYLAANPDVNAAGIDPLVHYLDFGVNEGRLIYAANS